MGGLGIGASIAPGRGVFGVLAQHVLETLDLALSLVLRDAVGLLDASRKDLPLAVDDVQVGVRQAAPLLHDLGAVLIPVRLDAIPVHCSLLESGKGAAARPRRSGQTVASGFVAL